MLVRAYAYVLRMGGDGLTRASEDAVLNANYLRVRLRDRYDVPHDRLCMHEFVASAARQKHRGASAPGTSPSASSTSACTPPPSTSP